MIIPIVDIFAGPGGLGEGFMSVTNDLGKSIFDIKLSIEKDVHAHKTLIWRSEQKTVKFMTNSLHSDYFKW